MTLTVTPRRRWKLRTAHLSKETTPSPIERLCRHEIWVRKNCDLVCRNCGKLS